MPLKLARKFAIRCSKKVRPDASLDELIAAGIRGASYWEILNPIRHEPPKNLNKIVDNDIDAYFEISLARQPSPLKRAAILTVRTLYNTLHHVILRPLHLPACAFLPWLTICLQKPAAKT
jgi:hypothetical protein